VIIGSGCAAFSAACFLHDFGVRDFALVTEDISAGTSRNTGSDKQTYYKLSLAGDDSDSVGEMARDLAGGMDVDGDIALCEAAGSIKCFYRLVQMGVPFRIIILANSLAIGPIMTRGDAPHPQGH